MSRTTLTVADVDIHTFRVGEVINIIDVDNRWFMVLWCFITRQPRKLRTTKYKIVEKIPQL